MKGDGHVTVNLSVDATATVGNRNVTLTTGSEVVTLSNGFAVGAGTPVITQVNPNTGQQGQTNLNVAITGQYTHFVQGTTTASFGAGITINSVTVSSATAATVNLTVATSATLGSRTVTMVTGSESVLAVNAFQVTASNATIVSVTPNSGRQAQTLNVAIVGSGTHWAQGVTTALFVGGINVNQLTVTDTAHATANITISPSATLGAQTVTLTTGGEAASLANGFTVLAGLPAIVSVSPSTGHQAQTLDVGLVGQFTNWAQGTSHADFGAGITVNSATVTDATSATVNITISVSAALGSRTVTMTTAAEVATDVGGFSVLTGLPTLTSANPNNAEQGQSLTVVLNGQFTHFQQGVTQAYFGNDITAGAVSVNGPQLASVNITISPSAIVGARTVTVTTGSEVASLTSGFTVLQGVAEITLITPNVGRTAQTLDVNVTGQFTNWQSGVTRASFGPGISVGGAAEGALGLVTITSTTSATAHIIINSVASLGPRDVTVTTGSSTQMIAGGFTVQSTSVTPPTILLTNPAANATGVPTNTDIVAEFRTSGQDRGPDFRCHSRRLLAGRSNQPCRL